MKIIIQGKGLDLTASIKTYINEKLAPIEKLIPSKLIEGAQARVEIARPSNHHRKGAVHYAEINLSLGKTLYRATAEDSDIRTAIDIARDEIKRQLRKEKTKNISKHRSLKN